MCREMTNKSCYYYYFFNCKSCQSGSAAPQLMGCSKKKTAAKCDLSQHVGSYIFLKHFFKATAVARLPCVTLAACTKQGASVSLSSSSV